jgi:hypothetical protein
MQNMDGELVCILVLGLAYYLAYSAYWFAYMYDIVCLDIRHLSRHGTKSYVPYVRYRTPMSYVGYATVTQGCRTSVQSVDIVRLTYDIVH